MFRAPPIRPLSFGEILDDVVEEARISHLAGVQTTRHARPEPGRLFDFFMASKQQADAEGSRGSRAEAYFEEPIELPVIADTEEAIAAELDLPGVTSLTELNQIRRAYALRHHPDRLHPALRGDATRRMKIANMLIDRRGKELARAAS